VGFKAAEQLLDQQDMAAHRRRHPGRYFWGMLVRRWRVQGSPLLRIRPAGRGSPPKLP
jgi:hypothetical protein